MIFILLTGVAIANLSKNGLVGYALMGYAIAQLGTLMRPFTKLCQTNKLAP